MTKVWESFTGYGTHDRYLAAKLKFLKNEIKKWGATDYPKEVKELHRLKLRIQKLDVASESRELSKSESKERRLVFHKIAEQDKIATLDVKQKARIRGIVDSDVKTRFFHSFVNSKQQKKSYPRAGYKWNVEHKRR